MSAVVVIAWSVAFCASAVPPEVQNSKRHKVAITSPACVGALPDDTANLVVDVIATEMQKTQSFEVYTPRDLGTLLGLERQRQLMGCDESSCIAEISSALDVDFVIAGSVTDLGATARISLVLLDPRKGTAVTRQSVEVDKAVDVMVAATKAVIRTVLKSTGVAAVDTEIAVVLPENPVATRRKLALGVGAAGVAALGVAIAFDALAAQAFAQEKKASQLNDLAGYDEAKARVRSYTTPAKVLYVGGATLAALGAAGYFFFGRSSHPTALLLASPNGAIVQIGGTSMKKVTLALVCAFTAGCSFGIDPDSVARPCLPSCEQKVCGEDDGCGTSCVAGGAVMGCTLRLHQIKHGRVGVGGATATAPGGHSVHGQLTWGSGQPGLVGGHSTSGSVSSP